jgi:uncharacterized membrane protein SpoIIM required for sporulation
MLQYLKALYGSAVAGLSTAYALTLNGGHIGLNGGIAIAAAAVGALAVIWAVPNAPAPPVEPPK